VYFTLYKILYLIGTRWNSTFYVPTSTMVSTYGTTVKTLQNTVHRSLILWKVSINDKDDNKTVTKNSTHTVLSLNSLLEFNVTKQLVYLCMHAIQKLATEKFLWRGYRSVPIEHMLLRDHVLHHAITTIHAYVTRAVNWYGTQHLKYYSWEFIVRMFMHSKNVLQCAL